MFILNGSPLAQGIAFTANNIQYPANWLNLTSETEKLAIGITWVADPVRADDRFYWNGDINNPKALEDKAETNLDGTPMFDADGKQVITKGLKSNFIAQVKKTAGSLLSETDWKVIRASEGGKPLDDETKTIRTAIRDKSNSLESQITACLTVEELASLNLSFEMEKL